MLDNAELTGTPSSMATSSSSTATQASSIPNTSSNSSGNKHQKQDVGAIAGGVVGGEFSTSIKRRPTADKMNRIGRARSYRWSYLFFGAKS